jgi:hypothetical protein
MDAAGVGVRGKSKKLTPTAKALSLTVPQTLQTSADEVIE